MIVPDAEYAALQRIADALERLATAHTLLALIEQQRFVDRHPRDDEPLLRAILGASALLRGDYVTEDE